METNYSTIDVSTENGKQLRDLIHMNIDSRDGFAYAGERLAEKHSSLSSRFRRYSQQRNDFYEKLRGIEEMNHEQPTVRGTIAASMHRTWMELRDELSEVVDISAVVSEALRGESYIKQAYETAIDAVLEPKLLALLRHQYDSVIESYSWLASLNEENEIQKGHATKADKEA
jgi:uncharacterized protein (TIGR02284 family)